MKRISALILGAVISIAGCITLDTKVIDMYDGEYDNNNLLVSEEENRSLKIKICCSPKLRKFYILLPI